MRNGQNSALKAGVAGASLGVWRQGQHAASSNAAVRPLHAKQLRSHRADGARLSPRGSPSFPWSRCTETLAVLKQDDFPKAPSPATSPALVQGLCPKGVS